MRKRLSFLIIILLYAYTATSQLYNFKNFSFDQGLPESRINVLCEDRRGNVWIGTSGGGLLRYDGYSFYNYLQDDGLINNVIHSIYEDHSGKLWIGTEEGICIYDGKRFTTFKELGKQTVKSILQDASNHFWFATGTNGLYKFDGKTLIPFTTTQKGVVDNVIYCLYLDTHANLWIGTPDGAGVYNKQSFKFYTKNNGLSSNDIRAISEDNQGNIWFATSAGISRFDGEKFTNYSTRNGLSSNDVFAVQQDNKGNLWFGTSDGISKYNGKSFEFYDTHTGQGNNSITCIYKDTGGNLWFGSSERGLSKLDSERFIHYPENGQMGKRVYTIIQAINGNIICGTSLGGTTVFDGKQYALLDKREGFTSSIVQSFYYAPDSTLWVGTQDEGVYRFSKSNFHKYSVEEGLPGNNITGFVTDKAQNLWVATADSGISVIQTAHDSLHIVKNYNSTNGLASNRISSIAYDRSDRIWIGTENMGINKITIPHDNLQSPAIAHLTTKDGLNSNVINCILVGDLNHVYVGTSGGITIFDGNRFFKISKANGLASNNIYSLTLDDDNNLWAGTERGVDMVTFGNDLTSVTIRHFDNDEGFKGVEVYRNSSCKDREGNLWFGTVNGLVRYNPKEEVAVRLTPKIHITGIKLFFDKIEDTPYADSVSAWYSIPDRLTLPYHQNNVTFSFTGIHHRNPMAVRYKWILEGFTKEWSPAMTQREAIFSNLPPGEYTFKVIACNEYNIWNETPASFTFFIEPPFWQRWWVRTAGFAAIVLFIWMIFQQRLQRIKAKNKIIQERLEMEKSILELEQEAARLQMNPHFIFNCLNSIQGFIAINDPFQAKKYLAKFAKLMRLILENAREEFIPLSNEINILENYLELEKLSANHKFEFSVTTEESIDPENIQIPPMMIQPFVENAIIHGIKKKEGKGVISIRFKLESGLIICEILDDGIGRKKSSQINGQARSSHKSTGISVTQKRLEQYGFHRKVKAGVEIFDLEADGISTGTKVVISTPFEEY